MRGDCRTVWWVTKPRRRETGREPVAPDVGPGDCAAVCRSGRTAQTADVPGHGGAGGPGPVCSAAPSSAHWVFVPCSHCEGGTGDVV